MGRMITIEEQAACAARDKALALADGLAARLEAIRDGVRVEAESLRAWGRRDFADRLEALADASAEGGHGD